MQKIDVSTLDKLEEQIIKLTDNFSERQIVLLDGPLGSGKTQSVRFIVKHLQGEDICSPSFSIHNTYETVKGDVEHIDLYRLEDDDDIESTGFWDLFEKEKGLILIEWANYLDPKHIPVYWDQVRLEFSLDGQARFLKITK